MKPLFRAIERFLEEEDGPTAVEYAVMLAMIVIVCLAAISLVGTRTNTTFNRIGRSLKRRR